MALFSHFFWVALWIESINIILYKKSKIISISTASMFEFFEFFIQLIKGDYFFNPILHFSWINKFFSVIVFFSYSCMSKSHLVLNSFDGFWNLSGINGKTIGRNPLECLPTSKQWFSGKKKSKCYHKWNFQWLGKKSRQKTLCDRVFSILYSVNGNYWIFFW